MLDPEKLFTELEKRGMEWADTDAAYRLLDDCKHSILSEAMADLNSKESMAMTKAKAERSKKYTDHLQLVGQARKDATVAKVKWISFQAYVDLKRSQSASRNAELNLR